jgi:hypothetical protein
MRALAALVMAAIVVGIPSAARADGGAYISLDETYYVVGDTAVATIYVAIPKSKRSLLSQGPFYAYVLNNRDWLVRGQPTPSGATRVGTFASRAEDGSIEFQAAFTVPALSQGWHHLSFCNEPCTIDGFREPLRGQFSIVQTEREAELLIENGRLHGQLNAVHRDLSKAQKQLEAIGSDLAAARREASSSSDQATELRSELTTTQAEAAAALDRTETEHRAALIVASELFIGVLCVVGLRRWHRVKRSAASSASSPSWLPRRSP